MKKYIIYALLILFFGAAIGGCGESDNKPVEELPPLGLSKIRVVLDPSRPTDEIEILSGEGGYYIVYPKVLNKGAYTAEGSLEIPYSDQIYSIRIDESNKILIECNPLWIERTRAGLESRANGVFIVRDRTGAKQTFEIKYPLQAGPF